MKKSKSFSTKLLQIIFLLFFFFVTTWILCIFMDKYPNGGIAGVTRPYFSETTVYRPDYSFLCVQLNFGWRGRTDDPASQVQKYYNEKWQESSTSGIKEPFHFVLGRIQIKNSFIIIDKYYGFTDQLDRKNETRFGIGTTIYFCSPKNDD